MKEERTGLIKCSQLELLTIKSYITHKKTRTNKLSILWKERLHKWKCRQYPSQNNVYSQAWLDTYFDIPVEFFPQFHEINLNGFSVLCFKVFVRRSDTGESWNSKNGVWQHSKFLKSDQRSEFQFGKVTMPHKRSEKNLRVEQSMNFLSHTVIAILLRWEKRRD